MNENQVENPQVNVLNVPRIVEETTDYFRFTIIDGNRDKKPKHLSRLKKSMSKRTLFTIITVNEKDEIIDGQHRFAVIQELGLPMYYVVCPEYGLEEVHILNQNSETWSSDDYLTGYCNMGKEDYIIYRDFKEKYNLGHNETLSLLTGSVKNIDRTVFSAGKFKVMDYDGAVQTIEKIRLVKPYYEGFNRRIFIFAMISLFKNENFNFNEFLNKLKQQPTALVDCTSVEQYKDLIEKIYNYRRKGGGVNLRYSETI